MKAITVCVNYDDYLKISLPHNKPLFDHLIVVTSPDDIKTQNICQENQVDVILTNKFYEGGAEFNKGKAINEALRGLDGWVCHFDSDILLPKNIKDLENLDKNTIYGCPRLMCPSKSAWEKYLLTGHTKKWQKLKASYFRLENSVINHFIPIGYTQIFHTGQLYPEDSHNAAESDVSFALQFKDQACLDNLTVIHMPIVGPQDEGINWNGRRSARFE